MSPAAKRQHDGGATTNEHQTTNTQVETIYTTVEPEPDRTDWLTVVSNLRQINRQLVEEIARLEQALASAKQTQHSHKEENQSHEITILQQQDELRIAHDRVGALFQQLETSHQIGQRQQTLIETLSQQLEITQTIVPQIEAEHEQLCQKYQQQSQKLTKTEQVAIELHRRLKLHTTTNNNNNLSISGDLDLNPVLGEILAPTNVSKQLTTAIDLDGATNLATGDLSPLATTLSDSTISTAEIDPAPPLAPIQMPQESSNWTSFNPTLSEKTSLSPSQPADPMSWREAISTNNRHNSHLEDVPSLSSLSAETANKESTAVDDPRPKASPNWPAPTVNRERSIAKKVIIDLPKFPKKREN